MKTCCLFLSFPFASSRFTHHVPQPYLFRLATAYGARSLGLPATGVALPLFSIGIVFLFSFLSSFYGYPWDGWMGGQCRPTGRLVPGGPFGLIRPWRPRLLGLAGGSFVLWCRPPVADRPNPAATKLTGCKAPVDRPASGRPRGATGSQDGPRTTLAN